MVFLTRWAGFPNGMAASQRIRMLSMAMAEGGLDVTVLCLDATEREPYIENRRPSGEYNGIHFEYTTGTTIRPERFFKRNILRLKGLLRGMLRLVQFSRQGCLDGIYFWITVQRITFVQSFFLLLANFFKIPAVIEVNERPWSIQDHPSFLERRISPVKGLAGAISISDYLNEWMQMEAKRIGKKDFAAIHIPILVDTAEQTLREYPAGKPVVLFAGSTDYDTTIRFIIDSMMVVWRNCPECRLMITGTRSGDPTGEQLIQDIRKRSLLGLVEFTGYLTRPELLDRYASSWALLIPLFEDVRSKARFPTKIGEYLASGRPVVTNSVGTVNRYLHDGVNAFVCPPNDPFLYGKKIMEAIEDKERSQAVGLGGRKVAEERFHYSVYGEVLSRYVESLGKRSL